MNNPLWIGYNIHVDAASQHPICIQLEAYTCASVYMYLCMCKQSVSQFCVQLYMQTYTCTCRWAFAMCVQTDNLLKKIYTCTCMCCENFLRIPHVFTICAELIESICIEMRYWFRQKNQQSYGIMKNCRIINLSKFSDVWGWGCAFLFRNYSFDS